MRGYLTIYEAMALIGVLFVSSIISFWIELKIKENKEKNKREKELNEISKL